MASKDSYKNSAEYKARTQDAHRTSRLMDKAKMAATREITSNPLELPERLEKLLEEDDDAEFVSSSTFCLGGALPLELSDGTVMCVVESSSSSTPIPALSVASSDVSNDGNSCSYFV